MNRFSKKPRPGGAANATLADARPRGGVRVLGALGASLALAFGVAACGSSSDSTSGGSSGSGGSIDLVAYSTPEEAYTNDLEPGFNATPDGDGVEFSNSFGASGDQSRAVEAGQPADVVHFALEPDMTRLVDAGMVANDWNSGQYKGIVENSVVVFVVRKGNPDNIQSWDDLVTGDEEVLTPNPFTSGGARWNLMAAYGNQVITEGKSEAEGLQYLSDLLANVPVQDESARDALGTFLGGKGDVLLSYENDAIAAQKAGEDIDYIVPDSTIKIETPLAATVDSDAAAQKFVDYEYTDEAQQLWADNGYRPVVPSVFDKNKDQFPIPANLFTIDDLGGWDQVSTDFFDPANGSVAQIEQDLGVATE
ncbi:MAG: sulfate/thiosulfate transport system substrate-binding protein [Solirubrobacterales bacterium]|jgi:sulfate transport system substrate-binding protein|nr:sulfate/thiosulfate transport system substrate-binding protein [Solirubrobacterales bacterium]